MRVLLCGLAVALMMATGAYGAGNTATINVSSGGLNTLELGVDFNPGETIRVDIDITAATAAMVSAQVILDADKPGLTYEACTWGKYTMPTPPYLTFYWIDNYDAVAGWSGDPFATAAWAGWLEPDSVDPTKPKLDGSGDLIALPGGALPTPWLGSAPAAANIVAPSHLGYIDITIPAAEALDYPVTISAPVGDARVGDPDFDPMDVSVVPLVLIPEPTSALLLLIGALPLLRRRR